MINRSTSIIPKNIFFKIHYNLHNTTIVLYFARTFQKKNILQQKAYKNLFLEVSNKIMKYITQ